MMRLLCCLLLLCPLLSTAQTYFNERYPNNGQQSYALVVLPTDSGYVVGGQARNTPAPGSTSLMLRFLDSQGRQSRVRYYGQANYYYFAPLGGGLLRAGSGYVLAGTVNMPTPLDQRAMLWRFNAQGDTLWTRKYVQLPNEYLAYSACQTHDGGYALVGSLGQPNGNIRFLLLRTDSLGNELWHRDYGVQLVNNAYTIAETPDRGFVLAGFTRPNSGPTGYSDSYVVKTDSVGDLQWQRTFGALGISDGTAKVLPTADGGYLVATTYGRSVVNGYTQQQPILYKLDFQGQTLWQKQIGPARYVTEFYALHEMADGSFVVAGQHGDTTGAIPLGNAFPKGVAFRICANGDSTWYRTYKKLTGGHSQNYVRDFRPTPDGGFVGAGYLFTAPPDTSTSDAWVFKVDQYGYLQAGGAPPSVQCRQPTGTSPVDNGNYSIEVFPNPSSDGRFTLVTPFKDTVTVTDALGRCVLKRISTAPETLLDLTKYPAGLYLMRLTWASGHTSSHKLLYTGGGVP